MPRRESRLKELSDEAGQKRRRRKASCGRHSEGASKLRVTGRERALKDPCDKEASFKASIRRARLVKVAF